MRRVATLVVAVLATTLLASSLSSCGTSTVGAGTVTSVGTMPPAVTPPITQADLDALLTARTKQFVKASNAFRRCDRDIVTDSYAPYTCLDQAAAVTGVVNGLLADVEDVVTPAEFQTTKADLRALVQRGTYVAKVCAEQADQKCDGALAAFRAADQSVHWSLSSTP